MFAGRLLELCWEFAGSCKHPITGQHGRHASVAVCLSYRQLSAALEPQQTLYKQTVAPVNDDYIVSSPVQRSSFITASN